LCCGATSILQGSGFEKMNRCGHTAPAPALYCTVVWQRSVNQCFRSSSYVSVVMCFGNVICCDSRSHYKMGRRRRSPIRRDGVTRFSTLSFCHQSILPKPLIIILKYFGIWFRFCRDIREYVSTPCCTNISSKGQLTYILSAN
jgi:hypothetical protein